MLPVMCTDGPAPCCDCLYQTVRCLVDAAAEGVRQCIGPECKEFGRYVSINRPADNGDFVAGWVSANTPMASADAKQLTVPKMATTIIVRLMESGYPATLTEIGGRIAKLNPAERDFAAQHFYSHRTAAFRAMLNAHPNHCSHCGRVQYISETPGAPEATFVWWEFTFRMVASV